MKKTFTKKIFSLFIAMIIAIVSFGLIGCNSENSRPATWQVNSYAPTADTKGVVGDMWLDTTTYDVYQLTNDGWIICGNIKAEDGEDGEDGAHGTDGTNGIDGATWLTGKGAPSINNVAGKAGDIYFDVNNCKIYKMNDAGRWEFVVTLSVGENPLQNNAWADDNELNILFVGNSFSDDTSYYMWHIANDLGIENVTIGNLHIGGCELSTHLNNARNDAAVYDWRVADATTQGAYQTTTSYKYSEAVTYKNWDFISFQQVSGKSGQANTFEPLDELIDLYLAICLNPDVKIVWNMTWAYQDDSTHASFANYGNDQQTMFNAIISATQTTIVPNEKISIISPTGTAIQNARQVLGDTLTRDGFHLAYTESPGQEGNYNGRYIAGLTFLGKVTGVALDGLTYAPSDVDEHQKGVAIQSAQDAIANGFEVTVHD